MDPISLDDQITCVQRELRLRENVYPRLVLQDKMRSDFADGEIAKMKAVLATLLRVNDKEGRQPGLGLQ